MKITFITPPSFDGLKPAERTAGCTRVVYDMPNIYELTVAAVLENAGYEVVYKNFVLDQLSQEHCLDFLRQDDSDCYCFWSVNLSVPTDMQVQAFIHDHRPDAWCLFLGPGSTYFTKEFLIHPKAVVVRGEPEDTIRELIANIFSGEEWRSVRGISYYDEVGRRVIHNPTRPLIKNLDELPFPAIHFIEKYTFSNPKLKVSPYMAVVSSRNCPFKCIYCVPSSLTFAREIEYKRENADKKPPIGFRSPENVVQEIEALAQKGYKAIGFMDDNFIVNKKRLKIIGEALKKHGIVWGCQARVDAIDEEIALLLQMYDCRYVDLGVESFNDEILAYIKKGFKEEQIYTAIALLKKYKVPVKLNILIGTSPIETTETIKDTLRKAKKLKVDQVMFNIVSPFPATEFYTMAKQNGWIEGGEYTPTDVQRHSILNYPNLTAAQMERLLFWNNIKFFLSPSFIWKNIRKFSSYNDFKIALKAMKIKLFG
ncbi:radical SAM protein [Parabacteroides sp. PF5-9]|uniref:B12-binding domain-containing radical SAM protein n=1 Tax=Parabacteroides sp. PF5-9 TaxID=1742404 RepID=UPI0024740FD8|nr:radical SAM protein [Parabacteroides sp. PF5-9]MDH6358880.1 anaerobic magnesium-protoporphyrin IX monomethyl ester cyclase [Parabacteroides sp. PF5-9]